MPLQTSGKISHKNIMDEFGHTGQFSLSANGAGFIGKNPSTIIKESDFYGAANGPPDLGSGNDGRGCFFMTSSNDFYFSLDGKSWSKYDAASASSGKTFMQSQASRYGSNFIVNGAHGALDNLNNATTRSAAKSGDQLHHNGPHVSAGHGSRDYFNGTSWTSYSYRFSFFSPNGTCYPSPCTTPGQIRLAMRGYKRMMLLAIGPNTGGFYTPRSTVYGGVTSGFSSGRNPVNTYMQFNYVYGKGTKFYAYNSDAIHHGGASNDWATALNKGNLSPKHIRQFGGYYYAVGNMNGSALARSSNLLDWQGLTPPSGLNTSSDKALQISTDGSTLVIVQAGTKAWYSTNGTSWTEGTCAGGWPSGGATLYKYSGDA